MNDRLIIFGESIWDIFEDGRKCLGGSGLNVAWHLQGIGQSCEFISRIGKDKNGAEILRQVQAWGIDIRHFQEDPVQPTAYLDVIIDENGGHQYPSPPEHALDFIEFQDAWLDFPRNSLMYHGTYTLRHKTTRETIARMKKEGFPVFLDLNLRENYWSHELLDQWLFDIAYIKVSDQEFELWKPGMGLDTQGQISHLQEVMKKRNIDHILFTLGKEGSWLIQKEDAFEQKPTGTIEIKNTVGAGDAYCAGFIYGLLHDKELVECTQIATLMAEHICTVDSATSKDKALYENFRKKYL